MAGLRSGDGQAQVFVRVLTLTVILLAVASVVLIVPGDRDALARSKGSVSITP